MARGLFLWQFTGPMLLRSGYISNIGPLRMLLGSPEIHHWHHDRDRDAGNYANISPLMDILFGTYRCPDHEPEHFGLNERSPRTYLGHLVKPLLPRKRRAKKPVLPRARETASAVSSDSGQVPISASDVPA
jgi:sterol desaturase/sphingolipid hydroxylase (fatty acid hydroxylase superfamily)